MVVKEIMEREVVYVHKDALVEEIAKMLANNNISGVPVVDDDRKVIGIVTEADLIQKEKEPRFPSYIEFLGSIIYIEGVKQHEEELKKLVATRAEEIMTTPVHTVFEEEEIEKVANIMVEERVNRVPVVNQMGQLIGIISRGDMLKPLLTP